MNQTPGPSTAARKRRRRARSRPERRPGRPDRRARGPAPAGPGRPGQRAQEVRRGQVKPRPRRWTGPWSSSAMASPWSTTSTLASAHADADPGAIVDGIRAVRAQALDVLARLGFPRREDRGARFDPARHEAVATRPDPGSGAAAGSPRHVLPAHRPACLRDQLHVPFPPPRVADRERAGRALAQVQRLRAGLRGLAYRGNRAAGHRPARPDRATRNGPAPGPAARKVNMDPSHLTQKSTRSTARRADQGATVSGEHPEVDGEHLLLGPARPGRGHRAPGCWPRASAASRTGTARPWRPSSRGVPRSAAPARARGRSASRSSRPACPMSPNRKPQRLKDDYVSVEHLLLGLLSRPVTTAGRPPAAAAGPDQGWLPAGADADPRQPAGHLGHARVRLRGARQVRSGPGGRRGQRPAST